jgi:hypothetical protein
LADSSAAILPRLVVEELEREPHHERRERDEEIERDHGGRLVESLAQAVSQPTRMRRSRGAYIIWHMSEIVFVVEEAPEGGFIARAVGESIFTEADSLAELHERAREAVRCHFDEGKSPKLIRLHYVRDEVIAA